MAGQINTKTFSGGMNKDLDFSLVKDNQYYNALNYKLVADEDSNGFVLENAEGNSIFLNISAWSGLDDNDYLVGHCYIQPYLVLFYTTNNATRLDGGATNKIVRIRVDKNRFHSVDVIYTDVAKSEYLNFSTTYPISAVGYYESDDNIKVYWTDGYNPVRMINIMDTNLSTYPVGMLDIVPDFPIDAATTNPRPQFDSIVSGNLTSCTVQYSYQFYIKNGATTLFAPASSTIIVPDVNSQLDPIQHKGGQVSENTGHGVKFTIEVPDTNKFNKIRVVAIQYNTYNGVPTVRIMSEQDVIVDTNYTLTFIDDGDLLSELTYEEYSIQNNTTLYARALAIKNDRLFLGNIREEFFDVDFDARAYRFRVSDSTAVLYDDVAWSSSDNVTSGDWSSVDADHNAIMRYNDPDEEHSATYSLYRFDNSDVLGAEGPNIKINFDTDAFLLDTLGTTNNTMWIPGEDGSTYPDNRTFHRQEVYRVGVVFRNKKMQKCPAKWSCDLKTPDYTDGTFQHLYTNGSDTYARRLGLEVTLKAGSLPTGAESWEIVYVPREEGDRSVLGQGIYQPVITDGASGWETPFGTITESIFNSGPGTYSTGLGRFISPEINFNKNLKYDTSDHLFYIGSFDKTGANSTSDLDGSSMWYSKLFDFTDAANTYNKLDVDNSKISYYNTTATAQVIVGAENYANYCNVASTLGIGGTCLICTHPDWHTAAGTWTAETGATEVAIVNYKRNVFATQYGGVDYYSRQYNTYVSISDLSFSDAGVSITTYEGDTFIDFFSYMSTMRDVTEAVADSVANQVLFPVESSIANSLRHDEALYRHIGNKPLSLIQEIAGTYGDNTVGKVGGTNETYVQDLSLYQYNSVYSQINKAELIPADSDAFDSQSDYPTRIRNSEAKINNETIDSFTIFKPNNFLDVDGSKGMLNSLMTFKNSLFFWQESGFGIASVNTRSLIQDNNPGGLALGTGGVLPRYDYISDNVGSQSQFGIVQSRTALYWGDNNKKEFFKFDNKLSTLSKLGGIQTWINGKTDIGEIKAVFDHKYNDVIFTVTFSRRLMATTVVNDLVTEFSLDSETGLATNGTHYNTLMHSRFPDGTLLPEKAVLYYNTAWLPEATTSGPYGWTYLGAGSWHTVTFDNDPVTTYTITFNEIANAFVSFNSFTPGRYIEIGSKFLSTDDYHDLYIHNDTTGAIPANRGEYYGVEYDSEFTTIFNKDFLYTKVWDGLKWYSESRDSDDIDQFKNTFSTITISNDYQHTGDREVYYKGGSVPGTYPLEVVRRDRTFSANIPRNVVDTDVSDNEDITDSGNWTESQTFKERIRDKYIKVKTVYDNTDSNTFSVPFISTVYRKSVR